MGWACFEKWFWTFVWGSAVIASGFVKFMYLPMGLLVICLSGCVVDNTRQISMSHAAYNQTLIQNKQEELLLNLVRLRYRDTPFFWIRPV